MLRRLLRFELSKRSMGTSARKDGFSGYLLVLFLSIGLFALLQEKNPGVQSVNADEAAKILQSDTTAVFIDVRTLDEWQSSSGHIENAILIPLQDLDGQIHKLEPFRKRLIVVYCRSGNRSAKAAKVLIAKGFNAVNMSGGIREWNAKERSVHKETTE